MQWQERCSICLSDFYNDPVLCLDAFIYCRGCIGKWCAVSEGSEWRSPRTNLMYPKPHCLGAVAELRFAVLRQQRASFDEADEKERAESIACSRNGPDLLSPRCSSVSLAVEVPAHVQLEIALRRDMLQSLRPCILSELLRHDRLNLRAPPLCVHLLSKVYESSKNEQLRRHLRFRRTFSDSLEVGVCWPCSCLPRKARFFRGSSASNVQKLVFASRSGSQQVTLPLLPSSFWGRAEDVGEVLGYCERCGVSVDFSQTMSRKLLVSDRERKSYGCLGEKERFFEEDVASCPSIFERLPAELPVSFTYRPCVFVGEARAFGS